LSVFVSARSFSDEPQRRMGRTTTIDDLRPSPFEYAPTAPSHFSVQRCL
jgi:hypothetical protein